MAKKAHSDTFLDIMMMVMMSLDVYVTSSTNNCVS